MPGSGWPSGGASMGAMVAAKGTVAKSSVSATPSAATKGPAPSLLRTRSLSSDTLMGVPEGRVGWGLTTRAGPAGKMSLCLVWPLGM